MVYRDTVVSTARLRRALILQLTLQLISGALATTPVAVNGHAPILDALLFPKWFILFLETLTCQYSQASSHRSYYITSCWALPLILARHCQKSIHPGAFYRNKKRKEKEMKSPNLINLLLFLSALQRQLMCARIISFTDSFFF